MRALVAGVVVVVLSTGCGGSSPPTDVVLVVESDIDIPDMADQMLINFGPGGVVPMGIGQSVSQFPPRFPVAYTFRPTEGVQVFSVGVQLLKAMSMQDALVAVRDVTGIRFVPGQQQLLRVSIPRLCACQGTSCVNALLPECSDVTDPELGPYDPDTARLSVQPIPLDVVMPTPSSTHGGPPGIP